MRSIRASLASLSPILVVALAAGLIREGQKWV
jgi:hypothetical protein